MSSVKYSGRSSSLISRDPHSVDRGEREPAWFDDFVSNLEKNSTKAKKNDYSMIEQITNILGNKSKYSSVEEAVLDMQKRTGLLDFLNNKRASADQNNLSEIPAIFEQIPAMKMFIDNYVGDRPGTSVESVVHDLLRIKSIKSQIPEKDDVSEDVRRYINDKIKEKDSFHPKSNSEDLQLGKLDLEMDDNTTKDNDPFGGCEPNKE
jgi:hypothetical protein